MKDKKEENIPSKITLPIDKKFRDIIDKFTNIQNIIDFKDLFNSIPEESLTPFKDNKTINSLMDRNKEIVKSLNSVQPVISSSLFKDNFNYSFSDKECEVCLMLKRNRIEPVIEYEGNHNKCIFHCEKTHGIWKKKNSLIIDRDLGWDERALKLFREKFYDYIDFIKKSSYQDIDFREAIFPEFIFSSYYSYDTDFSGFSQNKNIVENYYNCNNNRPLNLPDKVFLFEKTQFLDRFEIEAIDVKEFKFKNCSFQDCLTIIHCKIDSFNFFNCKVGDSLYLICNIIDKGDIKDNSRFGGKIYVKKLKGNERFFIENVQSQEIHIKMIEKDYTGGFYPSLSINNADIEKGLYVLDNKVKNLELKNISNKNIKIEVLRNIVDILKLSSIDNIDNSLKIINIEVEKLLNIENSALTSFEFRNCDFSNCKIEIINSSITGSVFSNVNFGKLSKGKICKSLFDNRRFLEAKEVFRQLKASFDEQKDYITANQFYSLEMEAYKEYLKEKKWRESFQDKLVFYIHGFISNFGQSWVKPFLLLIIFTFIFSFYFHYSNIKLECGNIYQNLFFSSENFLCYVKNLFDIEKFFKTLSTFKSFNTDKNHIIAETIYIIILSVLVYQLILAIRRRVKR